MAKHVLAILLSSYLVLNFVNSTAVLNDDAENTKEFHEAKSVQDGNDSIVRNRGNLDFEKTLDYFINEMETIKQFVDTSLTQIDPILPSIRRLVCGQFNKGASGKNLSLLARKKRSSMFPIVEKATQVTPTNFEKNALRISRSASNIQKPNASSFEDSEYEVPYSLQDITEFARKRGIFEADVDAESRRVKRQKGTRTNINPAHKTPTTPTFGTFPVSSMVQEMLDNVIDTIETVTNIVNKLTDAIDSIESVLEIVTTERKRRETRESFASLRSSFKGLLDRFMDLIIEIEEIFNNCQKPDYTQISKGSRRRRNLYTYGYPNVPKRNRFLPQTINNSLKNVTAAGEIVSNRLEFRSTTTMRNPQESGSHLTLLSQLSGNIVRGILNMSTNAIKAAFKLVSSDAEESKKV